MICCPRQESEIQNLPGQHIFFSAACFFYRKQQQIRAGSYLYRPKTAAGFKQDRVMQRSKADRNMHMKESLKKE